MMEGFGLQADKALLDTVFDGVIVIELKHRRISMANKAASDILGVDDPDELVGIDPLKYISPEDRERMAGILDGLVSGSRLQMGAEMKVLGKGGKEVWVEIRGVRLASNGNSVLLASFRDITAQKMAETARREAEKNQVDLLNASNELILISQDWKIVFANRSLQEATGLSAEALAGMSILDLTHPDDRKAVKRRYKKMLDGKYSPSDRAFKGIGKDGTTSWGMMRHVPVTWQGKPALMTIVQDITQQKLAEEALQESEKRYRLVAENASDVIWTTDADLNITYMTPSAARLLRCGMEEAMALTIRDMLTPESLQLGMQAFNEQLALETKEGTSPQREWSLDMQLQRRDGSTVWVEEKVNFIRDADGQITGLMGITRDISERKKAEQALRESEGKFKALVENAAAVVFSLDHQGNISYISPAIERLSGFKASEVVGKSCTGFVVPEDLPGLMASMEKTLSGDIEPYEFRVRDKDGGMHHVLTSSRPIIREGEVGGLIGVMVDITETKAAQEALKGSEERYRLLAMNASDIIWVTDANLKVTYASPSATTLLGYSLEEVTERSIDKLITPASLALVSEVYRNDLAREEKTPGSIGERTLEIQVVHKDGSTVWLEAAIRVNRDAAGRFSGFQGACRNITKRKQAEEALRSSEEKYRKVVENAIEGIAVLQDGVMKYINPGLAAMSGFNIEEGIGKSFLDFIHPDDRQMAMDNYVRRQRGEAVPNRYEVRFLHKDGSTGWAEISVALHEWDGKIATLALLTDITKRKQAEEALRDSEAVYKRLFENTQTAMEVISGETGLVTLANETAAKMFGFDSADDLIGIDSMEYILPEQRDRIAAEMARALAENDRSGATELSVRTKDGRWLWINALVTYTQHRGKTDLLISLVDLTSRKQAEETLQESEEKNRLLIDNAAEGIIVLQDGVLKFANPKCTEISGYQAKELLLRPFLQLVHPDDRQIMTDNYVKRLAGDEVDNNYRFRIVHKAGGTRWLQINTVQFSWEGRPALLSMLTDVTERKQMEEALEQSEERFRALIEGARDAIAVIDAEGKVTYSSPSAETMSSGSIDKLMTTGLQERVHPDDVAKAISAFESLTGSPDGSVVDIELRVRRADESWGVIEARATNRVHDPKIGGIVVNYRDITERRQAEEAFQESESRYRMLAENVSDVIWSVNLKSKRVLFSPSVTRLLGYTLEEAQTMKMKEVVSPTSFARAMMSFSNLMAKKGNGSNGRSSSTQIEIELMRKDGSFVWVDISVTLLRDAGGQPAEIFGVIRDITQRKKVEEDLRTSEEYFRALIENAWDAIAIVNAEGVMLYESPSSARILGYEPDEIVGRNLAEFVRPEDIATIADTFRRFRTEPGAILMVDAGFRHKEGHYVECEGTLQNFLHDPKISGVVANFRDVTDRRRAEEAIRNSEERFRNLVEATSDWVWEADQNGAYTYASPNVREVMGYEVGEVIGKTIWNFMPVREAAKFSKMFRSHAAKREPFAFVENSRLHKDGRIIIMETSGVPFLGDDGSLLGYRGIGRDISNRKKVEKDLENSLKKVEKTMEAAIQAISYTMETRDPYTTGHQRRVTQLACAIAKEMEMAPWQIDGLRVAGLLHDIGKIAVPTEILSKPGKLSDIEFSMIKAHPKVGFDILKNVEFEWPIARIVVQHHERLDGSGYPYGLRGKDILQESRILAVADVVEAMSSHRPYRPALGADKALAEVARGEGTLYDSDVVHACARVIKERGFKFES